MVIWLRNNTRERSAASAAAPGAPGELINLIGGVNSADLANIKGAGCPLAALI